MPPIISTPSSRRPSAWVRPASTAHTGSREMAAELRDAAHQGRRTSPAAPAATAARREEPALGRAGSAPTGGPAQRGAAASAIAAATHGVRGVPAGADPLENQGAAGPAAEQQHGVGGQDTTAYGVGGDGVDPRLPHEPRQGEPGAGEQAQQEPPTAGSRARASARTSPQTTRGAADHGRDRPPPRADSQGAKGINATTARDGIAPARPISHAGQPQSSKRTEAIV